MRLRHAALVACAAAALVPALAHAGERIVTVASTRAGVTENVLIVAADGHAKKAVALSFIGGPGVMHLDKRIGKARFGFPKAMNALLRIRGKVADADIVDALVDAPSDHPDGMADAFRAGAEHAADIRAVIADLGKRFPGAKIYLVGTSRGTISVAHLGVTLADVVAGAILTSTVTRGSRNGEALSRFDFGSLEVPTLFIHHVDDGCPASPYAAVAALAARFPVVAAEGGLPPESGPCDPLAPHGFYGLDDGVVAVMRQFMLGEPYPRKIS
jgi:hypothetical protein